MLLVGPEHGRGCPWRVRGRGRRRQLDEERLAAEDLHGAGGLEIRQRRARQLDVALDAIRQRTSAADSRAKLGQHVATCDHEGPSRDGRVTPQSGQI